MNTLSYIKPKYTFKEVYELQKLLEYRPCAFDDISEVMKLEGSGLTEEYDSEEE